jgi:hypothetical protein
MMVKFSVVATNGMKRSPICGVSSMFTVTKKRWMTGETMNSSMIVGLRPQAGIVVVNGHPQAARWGAAGNRPLAPRLAVDARRQADHSMTVTGKYISVAGVTIAVMHLGLRQVTDVCAPQAFATVVPIVDTRTFHVTEQAVSGALHTTSRRIRPRQPPLLSGLAEGVNLPASAGGASASAPSAGERRDNVETRRLG